MTINIRYHLATQASQANKILNLLNLPRLDKNNIKHSFNRSADSYDHAAILQQEVLNRLIERLNYIKLKPNTMVDIGCGTGKAIQPLIKQYPKAKLIALDLAFNMLLKSKSEFGLFNKTRAINADMEQLPIATNQVELIFSNLAIQWVNDLDKTLAEFKRIGAPGALVMFTTFGPETLWQLNDSWSQIDNKPHVHQFTDMHHIGDALVRSGFAEPVMDSETITLEYKTFKEVLLDLKKIGASNADKSRAKGLLTPNKLKQLEQQYREIGFKNGLYQASYDVIYGHAWLPV